MIKNNIAYAFFGLYKRYLAFPNADTSALEKRTDDVVYKLYLTPEKIAIVEGKNE